METPETTKAEAGLLAALKFCERRKASIPESEFRDGHALHMGKRTVHVDCLLKRNAALPVMALLLGIAGLGLAAYAVSQARQSAPATTGASAAGDVTQQVQRATESQFAAMKSDLAAMRKDLAAASAAAKNVGALDARLSADRAALEKRAQDVAAANDVLTARAGKLEESLNALSAKVDGLTALDSKFNALSKALADLVKDVNKLKAGATPTPPPGEQPPR